MEGKPFGRYRLVELLGRGGMGEVWRAFDTGTERIVAVKVLPTHLIDDTSYQERFRREARAAASLNEPHVVPIHDFGDIDGRLFVSMRLIEGDDLQAVLDRGPLSPQRAVEIIEQIASALNAAHRIGLVHRDVKPHNILVTDDDFAYLIDFGIARAAGETGITSTGATIGTWAYMAPERFSGGEIEPSSDIYALACVLYQSLTGQLPFPGTTMEQVAMAHMTAPPPKPSTRRREIPMTMDDVIAIGLAKDPRDRYPTPKDLANAARAALNQAQADTVAAPPPGQPASESAPTRPRGRWLASAAALAVILLAGVIALAWRPWEREGGSGPNAEPASTTPVISTPGVPSPPPSTAPLPPPITTATTTHMPTAVADADTPVIRLCGSELAVKPEKILLACADNTWAIDNLVWRSWGADGATGSGIEFEVTCVPNCAQGSATYSPVTITLTGAAPPDYRYTSAIITNQNTGISKTVGV